MREATTRVGVYEKYLLIDWRRLHRSRFLQLVETRRSARCSSTGASWGENSSPPSLYPTHQQPTLAAAVSPHPLPLQPSLTSFPAWRRNLTISIFTCAAVLRFFNKTLWPNRLSLIARFHPCIFAIATRSASHLETRPALCQPRIHSGEFSSQNNKTSSENPYPLRLRQRCLPSRTNSGPTAQHSRTATISATPVP